MMELMKKNERLNKHINFEETNNMLMNLPIPVLLKSMEMQLNILRKRGIVVRDFDNKERKIEQIRMIGNKAFFLVSNDKLKE